MKPMSQARKSLIASISMVLLLLTGLVASAFSQGLSGDEAAIRDVSKRFEKFYDECKSGASSCSRAAETAEPTPEQKARCGALADENDQKFCTWGYSVAGLKFPDEARELGIFTSVDRMALYKPEGDGPFPALVLLHTCGPIDHLQFRYWVKHALENGYVALVVDSWSPRGYSNGVCDRLARLGFNPLAVRTRDAYEALQHLSKFGFVDPSRVGVMGLSHGGRVTYFVSRKITAEMFSPGGKRFTAGVAFYGQCLFRPNGWTNLRPDVDAPLLVLLGELDEDGNPAGCLPRLQALKDKGVPVEWHVFPGTVHAWDNPKIRGTMRITYHSGPDGTTTFAYDPKVTDESRDRAFAFLARYLKQK